MQGKTLLKHVRFYNKLRVSFFKSNKNLYLQLIDDNAGKVLNSFSTISPDFSANFNGYKKKSNKVNTACAEFIANNLAMFISEHFSTRLMIFDRGSFRFGNLTKKIVDVLRDKGIKI